MSTPLTISEHFFKIGKYCVSQLSENADLRTMLSWNHDDANN